MTIVPELDIPEGYELLEPRRRSPRKGEIGLCEDGSVFIATVDCLFEYFILCKIG